MLFASLQHTYTNKTKHADRSGEANIELKSSSPNNTIEFFESWSRRLTASCPMFKRKNTKLKDRRYSLVHQWYLFSPIRIPWIPSGDAPEVVACRWLQANKDGWLKFDPCCGTRASGTCSCFYLRLWKNNNIDIPIPMQNADTYLPLRLSILRSWTIQCYRFSWFTCTYMCNSSKTPWDSTCVTLHQGRLHRNVSLLVQSHWKSLTSLTCPHAGKHNMISAKIWKDILLCVMLLEVQTQGAKQECYLFCHA